MSNNSILVVGGGFAGITAALEAAEVGHEVYIVETNPYLGGRVAQLNQYFPKLCPPSCGLEIQFQRIKNNPKVKFFTMAEVAAVTGGPGAFDVKIKIRPRYVNANCTMCGDCEKGRHHQRAQRVRSGHRRPQDRLPHPYLRLPAALCGGRGQLRPRRDGQDRGRLPLRRGQPGRCREDRRPAGRQHRVGHRLEAL
jgi:Heterodisulfide reductase, subunit A and related polyferredoxins